VNARPGSALALIVDHDLGFVMWLGEIFTELGWQAVPALHCRQALALTERFDLPITILLVNPELRGAERMIHTLVAGNPRIRLVLIHEGAADQPGAKPMVVEARQTLERPSPGEPISRPEWVTKIRKLLSPLPTE
jgi:hypothetical protein